MKEMILWFGFTKDVFTVRFKRLLVTVIFCTSALCAQAAPPPVVPIFSDDFESGTMSLWTTTAANPLTIATPENVVPVGGRFSAYINVSTDRMHHNIITDNGGAEVSGHMLYTFWIFDQGTNSGTVGATRVFNEIRGYSGGTGLPNGGTAASGALAQLLAAGKFNSVTLPGETFTTTKYQGRVAFHTPQPAGDTGWFNLNDAGSPNRSVGWHRFDIEVMPGGTTVRFYVDGILSRTFVGATTETYDTVILGFGTGTQLGDAWIDGISVGRVDTNSPAINCPSNVIAVATSSPGGAVVHYAVSATDDMDASPTINCTPPSGSTFPVGTTTVICTARDDAGNVSRCTFDVVVLPFRFEGFEHWSQGQAVLTPESNRLVISNLGSGGNDGWRTELQEVQAVLVDFFPFNYLTETCVVTQVEITMDGAEGKLSTELLLGEVISTAAADFGALGSAESEVEIRGANNELINKYRIPNGRRIDVGTIFPPPCINPPVVYSYFQDTNQVWYRFCKPECGPCIGTNCWIERTLCFRAVLPNPGDIKLKALEVRAQGAMAMTSLAIEDLKFYEFGNEHHLTGDGVVDAADYVVWRKNLGTTPSDTLEISPRDTAHPGGVNGIQVELAPLDLSAMMIIPCIRIGGIGTLNGVPAVQLGTASLRGKGGLGATENLAQSAAYELRADFQVLGATMVRLEAFEAGQSSGQLILPASEVLGDWNGDGRLVGAGYALPPDPCFRFKFDMPMAFSGPGGELRGDEFCVGAHDPQAQVQLLQSLSLVVENIEEFTILNETVDPAGEQFFPTDVMPPPTATWATFPNNVISFSTPAQGGLALRNLRLSFFDMSFEPPKEGEQLTKEFKCILDGEISRAHGVWECIGLEGDSQWILIGLTPRPDGSRPFEMEMLSLDLSSSLIRLRESPTRRSPGQANIRMLQTGGFMISSFFDVFTELSFDGQTWMPAEEALRLDLAVYSPVRSTMPSLPPAMGQFDMQCPILHFANGVMIRNVSLVGLQQGPSLQIPLGGDVECPILGQARLEHSQDGGATFQPATGEVRGGIRALHSFDYSETGFFDTELLQLDISGGTLPTGVRFRMLPPSGPGRSCLGMNDQQDYLIASFFGGLLEMSTTGGQTWSPSLRPSRFALTQPSNDCIRIRCPEDVRAWACEQGTIVNYPSPTAVSVCGTAAPHIECMPPSGSFFPIGTTQVNCRATDAAGNTAFCSFKVVVVQDSGPPIIVCPTNPVVRWICTNGTPILYPVTASDDCDTNVSIVCNPPSGSPLPPGDHTVVCDAIDDCGKRDRCQFVISVRPDTEPPKINCPSNIVVWTCSPNGAMVGYTVGATDDCDEDVELSCDPPPGPFAPGITTVTCRAIDGCGKTATCTFTVTVRVDVEPPRIECPTNLTVWTCSPNGMPVTYTVTATDDCDTNVTVICTPPSGSNFPPGVHTVTCVARDDCDQTSRCEFQVTVRVDTAAPQLVCPGTITNWVCSPNGGPVTYTVTATDDCDTNVTIVCDPPSGSNFPPGSVLVDCVATDDCGNRDQCRFFVITRVDQEPPRLICPTNIVVWTCDPDGQRVDYTISATDDCDTNVTITCTPPSGTVLPPGTHTVTCVAEDDCDHKSECKFEVRVILDREPPTIICPSNIVVYTCRTNERVNYRVEARDDCDTNVSIVCVPPPGSWFPLGTNEVRCVATDDCGNRSECRFLIIVAPEPAPRLTIQRLAGAPGFVICWPAPSPGWRLQCTSTLHSPAFWQNVTNMPVLAGGQWCVTLPNNARHRFYRLCKPCDPVITGVSHLTPKEGDVLTITGSGFGTIAEDLCVVIVDSSLVTTNPPSGDDLAAGLADGSVRFVPLRALSAQETFITARMGPVPPDVKPGRIMVGHGIGDVGRPQFAFPDIVAVEPLWVWRKFGPAAIGDQEVEPQPDPEPTPTERCFFSSAPENGELCVFVQGDWGTNCYVSIIARAHDSANETGGYDLDGPTVRFIGGGTTRDCVERIVDVLRCAFQQQAGVQIEVSFEEVPPGSGVFKITVRIPGGYIDRGMLTICVRCADDPVITGVTPNNGKEGDIVTIRGVNFPNDPNDICVVIVERPPLGTNPLAKAVSAAGDRSVRFIPLQALSSTPTEIRARLGPVPPNAQAGPIMIGIGEGARGRFTPAFPDIQLTDEVWTWRKIGDRGAVSQEPFNPAPTEPPVSNCWFFSEAPVDGKLCVFLSPNCPWSSNSYVTIIARAHDSTTGAGADLAGPNVRFIGGGTTRECAERIADVIRCAFLQQAGVMVAVQIDQLPDGSVKITVEIPGGHIDRGMLTICVGPNPTGGP